MERYFFFTLTNFNNNKIKTVLLKAGEGGSCWFRCSYRMAIFFLKKHPAETDATKNREGDPLILLGHPR